MGVRILYDSEARRAALYCSTSEMPFGPLFVDDDAGHTGRELAESFLKWANLDVRKLTEKELIELVADWTAAGPVLELAQPVTYGTLGDVRGHCGHKHATIRAAYQCFVRDSRACRRQGGYSDRSVVRSDRAPLTDTELFDLASVEDVDNNR